MATIKDIARLSGYSIGTVSRVLNHHPDVSEETKAKIEKVIRETNYEPNSNAKLLKQGSASAVTFIIRGYHNIFLQNILEEMQQALHRAGEQTAVAFVDENANEVQAALHLSSSLRPKGFFFLGGSVPDFKKYFGRIRVPCVLITNSAEGLDFDNLSSYSTDDAGAAKYAIRYLYEAGHRQIGVIGGSLDNDRSQAGYQRYLGCRDAFREFAIPDLEDRYEPSRFSLEGGYEAAKKLLTRHPETTAVFAFSDLIAIGAMRAIADAGLRCPDDVSVLGFDGIDIGRFGNPRLTTIAQDVDQLSELSVTNLLIRLHYPQREPEHRIVPYRLLEGESVKKV